jgi:hypothetical protein
MNPIEPTKFTLFRRRRIDYRFDFRNPVGREAAALRVLTHHLLVRRDVNAVIWSPVT